jgi:hypothetical protein
MFRFRRVEYWTSSCIHGTVRAQRFAKAERRMMNAELRNPGFDFNFTPPSYGRRRRASLRQNEE